jgi:hypothetical protein
MLHSALETNGYTNLDRNTAGKRPLGRPRHRWENNVKEIKELWCEEMNWIYLTHDEFLWRVFENTIINSQDP